MIFVSLFKCISSSIGPDDYDDAFDKNWQSREFLDCISVVDTTCIQTRRLDLMYPSLCQFRDM